MALPGLVLAIALIGDALIYAERLNTTFRVRLAPSVTDEWWAVSPDAYRDYVFELGRALDRRGIGFDAPAG